MIEIPLSMPYGEPVIIVSDDMANKAEAKAMCAEHGLDMVVSALVPPGTFFVYNPNGDLG